MDYRCTCGNRHTKSVARQIGGPVLAIQRASEVASHGSEYDVAWANWMSALRENAHYLGVVTKGGDDAVLVRLRGTLSAIIEAETEWQLAANQAKPRDKEAGIHHGALRGFAEDAVHWLIVAEERLKALKAPPPPPPPPTTGKDWQVAGRAFLMERQRARKGGG